MQLPPSPRHLLVSCSGDTPKNWPLGFLQLKKCLLLRQVWVSLPWGWQQRSAPAARQEAKTNSQVVCCVSPVDKYCWQPTLPHRGMLQETRSPPSQALKQGRTAKWQLNVPTACVICSCGAGLLLALISQSRGAVPMMLTPPWHGYCLLFPPKSPQQVVRRGLACPLPWGGTGRFT